MLVGMQRGCWATTRPAYHLTLHAPLSPPPVYPCSPLQDSTLCEVGASPWDLRSVQALMQLAAARPDLTVCLDGGSCLRAVGAEAAAAAGGSGDVPQLPAPEA